MSNYTKATDFAAKDALLTGNPAKLVKGTEIGTEFDNIATAIATKLDSTGTVLTTPQINDTSSNHRYIFAVSELAADRTVTLPLLTGNDEYVFKDHAATLTNKTLTSPTINTPAITDPIITGTILEDVYTITDGAAFEIDPGNGSVQLITLGANRTPKATNFAAGEAITLMVLDGTAYTLTWTDATFGGSGVVWVGGTAPTLDTTKYTVIELWKVSTQVYGASVGAA
jgi:hypothetical protein